MERTPPRRWENQCFFIKACSPSAGRRALFMWVANWLVFLFHFDKIELHYGRSLFVFHVLKSQHSEGEVSYIFQSIYMSAGIILLKRIWPSFSLKRSTRFGKHNLLLHIGCLTNYPGGGRSIKFARLETVFVSQQEIYLEDIRALMLYLCLHQWDFIIYYWFIDWFITYNRTHFY